MQKRKSSLSNYATWYCSLFATCVHQLRGQTTRKPAGFILAAARSIKFCDPAFFLDNHKDHNFLFYWNFLIDLHPFKVLHSTDRFFVLHLFKDFYFHSTYIFFFLHFLNSFLFSKVCIKMSCDFFIRSVFAFKTLNFEGLLVFILCIFSLNGNMFLHFGCLLAFLAKFKHNFSRRFSNVSSSSMSNAFWYDLYLKPRIILSTVFCTLSRSSLFSTVIELCNCARPNKSCCGESV